MHTRVKFRGKSVWSKSPTGADVIILWMRSRGHTVQPGNVSGVGAGRYVARPDGGPERYFFVGQDMRVTPIAQPEVLR